MDEKKEPYSIKEYILFKLDRNIAIFGLVSLGITALILGTPETEKIVSGVVAALAVYLGARGGNK
jgi:hypothetical protein